jgi:hypothetical protein
MINSCSSVETRASSRAHLSILHNQTRTRTSDVSPRPAFHSESSCFHAGCFFTREHHQDLHGTSRRASPCPSTPEYHDGHSPPSPPYPAVCIPHFRTPTSSPLSSPTSSLRHCTMHPAIAERPRRSRRSRKETKDALPSRFEIESKNLIIPLF